MKRSIQSTLVLNNGVEIPQLGFGTALISKDEGKTVEVILEAIEAGYRHFDTAMVYYNEGAVGKAVRQSGIPREEFFITTKLWNEDMRQNRMREAFEESLERLGMDYVDMYMIHWPVPLRYVKAWAILSEIYESRRARVIGVSNFLIHHLEDLRQTSDIVPAVNQVEFNPRFMQPELHAYCKRHGIFFEALKPLGQGAYVGDPVLEKIARANGKSFAQVLIRWHLQHGIIAIPKASSRQRIRENCDVFDFELDSQEMSVIDAMHTGRSTSTCTPDCFDF